MLIWSQSFRLIQFCLFSLPGQSTKHVFYLLYRYYPLIYNWHSTEFRITPTLGRCFWGKSITLQGSTKSYVSPPRADRPTASCEPSMKIQSNRLLIRRESRPCHHGLYCTPEECAQNSSFFLSKHWLYTKLLSNDDESLCQAPVAQRSQDNWCEVRIQKTGERRGFHGMQGYGNLCSRWRLGIRNRIFNL